MDPLERVVCPRCLSDQAGVVYRGAYRVAHYCPDCDQAWEDPPTPSPHDPQTLRNVMRAAFKARHTRQKIARAITLKVH